MEIGNFEDLVRVLKLKIVRYTPNSCPNNLGCHCGAGQLSGGVP